MNKNRQNLTIADITTVNEWVKKFRFVSAAPDRPLASFEAGQFLNLFYEIDGATTCRPYSIASSPKDAQEGFYDLYIHSGGSFTSSWLCNNAVVGMAIQGSVPAGTFCYSPERDGKKVIGISGGMSVTPLYAMAKAVVDGTLDIDLTLFCGWDAYDDVLYYEEFSAFAQKCPRFRAVFILADELRDGFENGYVSLELIQKYTDPSNACFFMCGPSAMYNALDQELASLHVPAERYHREIPGEVKFGAPGTESLQSDIVYTLTVQKEGNRYSIPMRSDETILVALERAAFRPEARCRSGSCGYCGAKLNSGSVFVPEYWCNQEQKRDDHIIHICCSFPTSDVEITLTS